MIGICRLCASVKRKDTLTTISSEEHEICTRIRVCCSVHIKMTDEMPKVVCQDCVQTLEQCYKFYVKVRDAQESLALLFPKDTQTKVGTNWNEILANLTPDNNSDASSVEIEIKNNTATHILTRTKRRETVDDKSSTNIDAAEVMEFEEIIDSALALNEDEANVALEENSIHSDAHDNNTIDDSNENFDIQVEAMSDIHEESNSSANISIEDMNDSVPGTWTDYPWECVKCKKVFTNFVELKKHAINVHELSQENISYKCADCQKICPKYFNFLNHVRFQHRTELCLCCDACNDNFENASLMANHRESCNAVVSKKLPRIVLCNLCGRAYANSNAAQMHLKNTHLEQQTLVCGYCDKVFKRSKSLQMHMERVHSGIKEYKCHICDASFAQKINLQNHLITHTDIKAYKCSVCDKSYKTATNLQKHALLHTEPRQFKCDYCDNYFRTKDAKQSHERTHTGEKPYHCQYCERKFRYRSVFTAHLNTHTGVRPYSCRECDHHFTNWSNFNKHLKRRHNTTATEASLSTKTFASSKVQNNELDDKSQSSEATLLNIFFEDNADSTTTEYVTSYQNDDTSNEETST